MILARIIGTVVATRKDDRLHGRKLLVARLVDEVIAFALRIPEEQTAERVARRVAAQFDEGLLDEMRGLLARGVPETALPFTGLVYRQALEHLHGVRDEAQTRELIVRENRKYSRRQLIWFRKEPNLRWIHAAGERAETQDEVARLL